MALCGSCEVICRTSAGRWKGYDRHPREHHPVALACEGLRYQANPLSYQVDALRGLLLGTPHHLALDYAVLVLAAAAGITAASSLLGRLAR